MVRIASRLTHDRLWLVAVVPGLFAVTFYLYPLASLLFEALTKPGLFGNASVAGVLWSDRTRSVLWFTFWQAAASTGFAVLLGLPLAYAVSRARTSSVRVAEWAVTAAFVLPTAVVATAFSAVLRPGGFLGWLQLEGTVWALIAAHVFFNLAVVVRLVGTAWSNVDTAAVDAARVLGAGPWRAFREAALPVVRPAIVGAASLVFVFTFTSFAIVLLLGGRRSTIEVEIYRQVTQLFDVRAAALLTMLQLVVLAAVLGLAAMTNRRTAPVRHHGLQRRRIEPSRRRSAVAGLATVIAGVVVAVPLAGLVQRSLQSPAGWTLDNFHRLSQPASLSVSPYEALGNSFRAALVATLVALVVGVCAATVVAARKHGRWLELLLALPIATSGVVLGLGFLLAFDQPPLELRTAWILTPLVQAAMAVPLVVRVVSPALQAIAPSLRDAARTLGARPWQVWRHVDLPLARGGVVVGGTLAFAIALGDFGATSLVARLDEPTLPLLIGRLLGLPGAEAFGQAMASAVLLAAVVGTVVAVAAPAERR